MTSELTKRFAATLAVVFVALASPSADQRGESAQTASAQDLAGMATASIAALEGEWNRNERVSEDPIQKTASLWRNPERTSAVLTGLSASLAADEAGGFARPATIRIVPLRRGQHQLLRGSIEVETLIVGRSIGRVDFFLDGRRLGRVRKLPFRTRINLAEPPREQTLEVRAYSVRGAFMGGDRLVLNRIDPPFGIRIGAITPSEPDGAAVQVETRVAVPRGAVLERVDFYRNEELAWSVVNLPQHGATGGFRTVGGKLPTPDLSPNDYVRVTATLADGRQLEDAQLIEGVAFKGEIDVQLVHLQVLVVDSGGAPVDGLTAADFRIVEDGERKAVEDVQQAGDVPLLLGMAIDSSASMKPIWNQLRAVVGAFLENSLAAEDRAFLVDFDESIRLLQQPTGSLRALRTSMDRLIPNGGTALNDGILFSLILYGAEPGRRALVVVTDGVDIDSRSEPEQAAAFAEQAGIPIYLIDLGRDQIALPNRSNPDGDSTAAALTRTVRSADRVLRMRQQAGQSGGRLFQIDPELPPSEFLGRVQQVFEQIREDLRRQQVLTYYTSRPIGAAIDPDVQAVREGLTVKSVLPLDRVDTSTESTRTLSGTPTAVQDTTEYTYTATDTDDDAATLSSSIKVEEGSTDDADFVSVSGLPSKMAAGGKVTVTATMTNTGTTMWTPFGGYGLGSQSPQDNDTWGLRRAPLSGSVAPNETTTFEFPVTAPEETGSYTFAWRMVRDPGAWFGSGTGDVTVTVEDPSFGDATILDQTWVQDEALQPLTLPAANGGDGELAYALARPLPAGVRFDATTRVLSGTPTTPQAARAYTYTATDTDGDAAALSFPITVRAGARDDAAFVSVLGLPSKMAAGGKATVTVTMTNTGRATWTPFGGYGLGTQSPQDNDTWGLRRAPLSGSVAPNETATFEFPITAPEKTGSYTFAWRMVRDPGGWFGSGTREVTVSVEDP